MGKRTSNIERKTSETSINLSLNLDGEGKRSVSTGIGFFDHMLDLFAKHALFDLEIKAEGDTNVDYHHTVEDVGICLGQAVKEALGDKAGIVRFSNVSVPMQESLANIAIDISGRSALVFNAKLDSKKIGDFDSELIKEFLEAFTVNAGLTSMWMSRTAKMHITSQKRFSKVLQRPLTGRRESMNELMKFPRQRAFCK